jgi:ABC-2 type transport system ATP-binding protein
VGDVMKDNIIEIKKLKKSYGKTLAVDHISLTVEKGDFYGFIGPNGSGKSTTINCMLNYIFQDEGMIKILGLDNIKDTVAIKKNIGYVPSEVFYYDNMRVKDIFDYSNSFYESVDKDLIKKYSKLFDIELNKKMNELSLGNKKKVAIVQCLLHNPKVLILDEPTNGLDPLMQLELFELLSDARKNGTTIFMSSHILNEVQKYCNKLAFIKSGKIIKSGMIEEFMHINYKIISIKSNDINEIKKILPIKEVDNPITNNNTLTFTYKNNINDLIKLLSNVKVDDISIESPTLEDLFISYYKDVK